LVIHLPLAYKNNNSSTRLWSRPCVFGLISDRRNLKISAREIFLSSNGLIPPPTKSCWCCSEIFLWPFCRCFHTFLFDILYTTSSSVILHVHKNYQPPETTYKYDTKQQSQLLGCLEPTCWRNDANGIQMIMKLSSASFVSLLFKKNSKD
jgi:hypothetical protein